MMIRIVAGLLLAARAGAAVPPLGIARRHARRVAPRDRRSRPRRNENERLKERNRTLAAEVRDLKEGRAAIEERARTDLGMVGSNETFFQVVPPPAPGAASHSDSSQPATDRAGRGEMKPRVRRWAVVPAAGRGATLRRRRSQAIPACSAARAVVDAARAAGRAVDRRHRRRACAPATGAGAAAESRDPRVQHLRGRCPARGFGRRTRWMRSPAGRGTPTGCWCTMQRGPACVARTCTVLVDATARRPGRRPARRAGRDTLKARRRSRPESRTARGNGLWRALTPQMFRYGLLKRALALCLERERAVTDEASAIEALGLRPLLVRGRSRQHQAHECGGPRHSPRRSCGNGGMR